MTEQHHTRANNEPLQFQSEPLGGIDKAHFSLANKIFFVGALPGNLVGGKPMIATNLLI